MNIVFDNIIYNLQYVGGISAFWTELVKRIEGTTVNREYIEYEGCMNNLFRKNIDLYDPLPFRKLSKIDRYLPIYMKKNNPFVFHSSYYRFTTNKLARQVVTVHDFMYERFDKGLKKMMHSLQKVHAIKHADVIVCISESAKDDMLYFYPQFKNKEIKIIYNGVGSAFMKLQANALEEIYPELNNETYILIVGNRVGCKNFKFISDIFCQLDESFALVIVGKELSEEERKWLKFRDNHRRIHLYQSVLECDLNVLYNKAYCLLIPSLYEGFGIPIVEAMKAGCPVVTTPVSSIPEVAGNAALYIQNFNIDSAIEQIYKLKNVDERKVLTERGFINATRFSWNKNFEEYMSLYRSLV